MPRHARIEAPHSLHHLIGRCLNREFLLIGAEERAEYLRRIPAVLTAVDMQPLGYALMSNHTHLACRTGRQRPSTFIHRLHGGFAAWLNGRLGRLGPVFAGRFTDVVCPEERTAFLLAYIHNNPVRAGVVADPADSDWTSHRAYLGLEAPPAGVDIHAGLAASGFDASPSGRLHFHAFVLAHAMDPREPRISGADLTEVEQSVRCMTGAQCSIGDALLSGDRLEPRRAVEIVPGAVLRPRWPGQATEVVQEVAALYGVAVAALRSRMRRRDVVDARRCALHVWTAHLGRLQVEMCGVLGLSSGPASRLLRKLPSMDAWRVKQLVDSLWNRARTDIV